MDPVSTSYPSHPPADLSMTPRARRAQEQFAREHAEQVLRTRAALQEYTR